MNEQEKRELLINGASQLGISLTDSQVTSLLIYLGELQAWNKKINLTAIEGEKDILIKHFLDSLAPARHLGGIKDLLDIGAGGGFPGIPLKIALPELYVTLIDAVGKKVHFMKHIIRTLGLSNIEAVSGRVESPEIVNKYSGSFDCVTSRAFTELGAFLALGLPYAKKGGLLLAMKGPSVEPELAAIKGMAEISSPEIIEVEIPFSHRKTSLVMVRKL